jgi:hypothetical protein
MDTQEFYEVLFRKCTNCTVSLMTLPYKQIKHYPVEQLKKLHDDAAVFGKTTNTYFSVWPRGSNIPNGVRGGSEDTVYATCLFADYDVAGPAHKEKNLPPSKEAVLEHLKGLEKPPTIILDTGYGLDPFWMFNESVPIKDDIVRDRVFGILAGYGRHLKHLCKEQGWALDNVFDPARMLRTPGSNNFKLESPAPCRILWESGIFYALEDFGPYYEAPQAENGEPFTPDEHTVGSAERVVGRCLAVQKMMDDPEAVSEPLWHALCSNIALTPDGEEKFHAWSSPYSGYSYEETEYKVRRAREVKKPCTCAYIREGLGFLCPEEGCGVKAPIVLGEHRQRAGKGGIVILP